MVLELSLSQQWRPHKKFGYDARESVYIIALNNKYTWCDLTDNYIKLYVSFQEILLRKYSGYLILREPKCNLDVLPYN